MNIVDLSVLVVHPTNENSLPTSASEAAETVNILNAKIIQGNVTISGISEKVYAGDFDMLWFIGHGSEEGIHLSDGMASSAELAQIIKGSGIEYIYLNTCSSHKLAVDIHDSTEAAVICTVADVEDRTASLTGITLARKILKAKSIREAYELSKPDRGDYRLIGGAGEKMDRLDLVIRMLDDQKSEINGIKTRMDKIESELFFFRNDIKGYMPRPTAVQLRSLTAGSILMILVIWLGYYDVRTLLDINYVVGLIISAVAVPFSFAMISYGLGYSFNKEEG